MDMTVAKRFQAIEARVSVLEDERDANNDAAYQARRATIETKMSVHRILDHLGLDRVTQAEVDEELDGL